MTEAADGSGRTTHRRRAVGIVGAGQLARMTIEAASALGVPVVLLAEDPIEAATELTSHVLLGAPTDAGQLWALAARCDVVTFDHEQVDLEMLTTFEEAGVAVRPGVSAMRLGVDKAHMRLTLAGLGVPVVAHQVLDRESDASLPEQIEAFGAAHGWPLVLKASRGGYDGKGVWPVADIAEAITVWQGATDSGVDLLVEAHVPIDFELSALVVRRPSETLAWPVVETTQIGGVCREVSMPGRVTPELATQASAIAVHIADAIGVVGVMAVEMFVAGGALMVNELACRPHNSGHWTIEGAVTSQFENHVRAVLDVPLGSTAATAPQVVTVNVFGPANGADPVHALEGALGVTGAHVHLYGKEARPGRKLGHVTVCGNDAADVKNRAWHAARELGTPVPSQLLRPAGSS
ncbi:MAG: 5-(carboxyamino)imidazole ribonucleotide synthase [Acidimicrobiales bacterium]